METPGLFVFGNARMTDREEDTPDDLEESPGVKALIGLSGMMIFVGFLAMLAVLVATADTNFYIRVSSGPRVALTRQEGVVIFVAVIGFFAIFVAAVVSRILRQLWSVVRAAVPEPLVPLEETLRWIGRPGWRSFRGPRVAGAAFAIAVPLFFFWWAKSILDGSDSFPLKLFWLYFPWFLFFGSVLPGYILSWESIRNCFLEAFGFVAITKDRIVWQRPLSRRIYRQIPGNSIIDAFLIENDGRRGTLAIIRQVKDDVEQIHICGLPEPEQAEAAAVALMGSSRPPSELPSGDDV